MLDAKSTAATVPTPGIAPSSFRRLAYVFIRRPLLALQHAEHRLYQALATHALVHLRIALGLIFLWFGALKFYPIALPIDQLAERVLVMLTLHHVAPVVLLHLLAVWECAIGLGLLTGCFLRPAILLLFLQMPGTFLPLLVLRHETWIHFPWFPTFEGQYIIKNFVLIAAAIVVAATCRGGKIIANPIVAAHAKRVELAVEERDLRTIEQTEQAR
jgi:uncharacterized membrane protein YkgB